MKLLLAGIIFILVIALYYWLPIRTAVKTSQDIIANTIPYQQRPENPRLRILVAGDSTAFGTGAADARDSISGRVGTTYPEAEVTTLAVNGLQLKGLNELLKESELSTYDVIIFQIGANDVTGFTRKATIRRELEKAVTFAEQRSPVVILVTAGNVGLSPVFRQPLASLFSWRTRMVREVFMEIADQRPAVTYVDLYVTKEEDVFMTNINRYYAADLFHPSGAGYGVWFEDIKPILDSQVGQLYP